MQPQPPKRQKQDGVQASLHYLHQPSTRRERRRGKTRAILLGGRKSVRCVFFSMNDLLITVAETVGKDDFFDMIKSGGIVSKV